MIDKADWSERAPDGSLVEVWEFDVPADGAWWIRRRCRVGGPRGSIVEIFEARVGDKVAVLCGPIPPVGVWLWEGRSALFGSVIESGRMLSGLAAYRVATRWLWGGAA